MKEEALKLAHEIDSFYKHHNQPYFLIQLQAMIRRLVEELDKQYKFGVDWGKDDKSVTVLKICEDGIAEIVFVDYQERLTPQTKPLSDKEIGDCVDDCFGLMALQHKYIYDIDQVQEYGLKLARAIEERHGIK